MPKADFAARRKEAEASGELSGGGFYKYQEGNNRFRLMDECLPHRSEYKGQQTFKWLTYILDRRDGKIKPHLMPHTVYKQIEALQLSEDYHFEEVPMPFDVTVHAKGAGTKEVEYTLMPARKELALTPMELQQWEGCKPLAEIKQALRDKRDKESGAQTQPATETGIPNYDDDGVPF